MPPSIIYTRRLEKWSLKEIVSVSQSPESTSKDSVGNMCELLLGNKYQKGASCGFGQVFQKC